MEAIAAAEQCVTIAVPTVWSHGFPSFDQEKSLIPAFAGMTRGR